MGDKGEVGRIVDWGDLPGLPLEITVPQIGRTVWNIKVRPIMTRGRNMTSPKT